MGSKRQLLIAGANLTALAGGLAHAGHQHSSKPNVAPASLESQANELSLRSIEKTWAHVPIMCKDRSFNAEPQSLPMKRPRAEILALYQA